MAETDAATGQNRRFLAVTLLVCWGPVVWFLHLNAVYVLHALACERGFGGVAPGIAALTLAAAAALVLPLRPAWRRTQGEGRFPTARFIDRLALALGAFSLLGIAWNALPVLLVPHCA
ncbi:MAG TPA: hypothetical protein VEB20_00415 [Azospirillaceae bacterium]|nr:hypothetical protein [Azospirillaceae bacterium]